MSGLLVPSHFNRPPAMAANAQALSTDLFWTHESVAAQVMNLAAFPQPRGHKVAVLLVQPPEKVGTMIVPDHYREKKGHATTTGVVIGVGETAYQDRDRFPSGPLCQLGEVVVFAKYAGQPISLPGRDGKPLAITFLNDDEIIAGWGMDLSISLGAEAAPAEPPAATAATTREPTVSNDG